MDLAAFTAKALGVSRERIRQLVNKWLKQGAENRKAALELLITGDRPPDGRFGSLDRQAARAAWKAAVAMTAEAHRAYRETP